MREAHTVRGSMDQSYSKAIFREREVAVKMNRTTSGSRLQQRKGKRFNTNLIVECSLIVIVVCSLLAIVCHAADSQTVSQPISSRAAFLRAQRASRLQQQQQKLQQEQQQPASSSNGQPAPVAAVASPSQPPQPQAPSTTVPTAVSQPAQVSTSSSSTTSSTAKPRPAPPQSPFKELVVEGPPRLAHSVVATNRTTRTADIEDFNIFVTNTCEREVMHVNIKTSKPFYGVIHTRNQRRKAVCSVEGTGDTEYNLDISHVLIQQDPNYCGVIKARRDSPDDKDLLSVIIAVRVHKDIQLSNDKFFLLNCTNRCRRADCSANSNARLSDLANSPNARVISDELPESERESVTPPSSSDTSKREHQNDECTIYKFPWVITLLWCLGILLLASLISHCIMCSSMVCKCVKTEVEEREPSVYEGDTDDEDNLYNRKNHPMRIDYDNREIYKTSNNYEPYNMEDDSRTRSKTRHTSSKKSSRR